MSCPREGCSGAADYRERCMQWMEDNKPSCAPDDFSSPKESKPTSSQLPRSNTIGSPDVYERSATGEAPLTRTGSFGGGHVKQLVAGYEARSRRAEDLSEEAIRRKREADRMSQDKDSVASAVKSDSETKVASQKKESIRSAPDLRELQKLPVPNPVGDKYGPALQWFMSQNFLDDSYETPPPGFFENLRKQAEEKEKAESLSKQERTGKPARAPFPDLSIEDSARDRKHDAYYNILLRRRKIQEKYRNRELVAKGKLQDWNWCGFPGCNAAVCLYQGESEGDIRRPTPKVLVHSDNGASEHVSKRLLEALNEICVDDEAGLHSLVTFAASPPILRAAADCVLSRVMFDADYQSAAATFEDRMSEFPPALVEEHKVTHEKLPFYEEAPTPKTVPEVVLRFLMRAESWRGKQAEQGYPWNWPLQDCVHIFKGILDSYRELFDDGHVVLVDEPFDVLVDKQWRHWLDTYRPMPPRLPQQAARALRRLATPSTPITRYLSTSTAFLAAPTAAGPASSFAGVRSDYVPVTKPPSARPPETRKSQLIRTYTSLLRTTPLILFFQHSNLTADEWSAVRRELNSALDAATPEGSPLPGRDIHLQVLRTRMFNVALKLAEFYDPEVAKANPNTPQGRKGPIVHDLSMSAYEAMKSFEVPADSAYAQIAPLMCGPTAALVFPAVSPAHLAAALKVLSPSPPAFAAPTRKKQPSYYDPLVQSGLQKLLLVGGRIEGDVFDVEGVRWVGGIEGGLDGLRAQLVHLLQSAGLGLTTALEAGGKSLWLTLEGRKTMLEDEGKEGEGEKKSE
ncbi:hypothetical protein CkaCkLH20_08831 [Colletotrichum karsti]|uniref:Uncharacterized protein n=1 Tax=Colletotrichum karsti TaxID=1095194 RepID=A0A9P6LHZ7_9PEZI|nr:uncharacterized protein CkaCkLH20_08831 [Colletotrichum karsti]KAF9873721.1 hypothetical protein CkaCkLH20_08831 [Colletotrichum karsti]